MNIFTIEKKSVYAYFVIALMFILPIASIGLELVVKQTDLNRECIESWFIFWALGVRLLTAGIMQVCNPEFTRKIILNANTIKNDPIVKELGFANISLGLLGVIAYAIPTWKLAAAFTGGLFMGLCGILHALEKPVHSNRTVAMVSDILIFLLMAIFIIASLR